MTLTSLLNSLHSHLQQQTQLLPTLHAQLGLPSTALEDDLKDLQEQLIRGVERQIDLRRNQVDEWMGKCDAVESICLRYTKALGGNIKATGSSLGEIRKEQSLPRRYELVTEFQEKLRQAYHAKLEQLNTLTNRLNLLARTLGSTYFPQDMLDTAPALDEAAFDQSAPRDVTPERFLKLEKELVRGKAEVTKRLHQLSETFAQIDWLYTELGMSMSAPLPDTSCMDISTDDSDPFCVATPTPASRSTAPVPKLFQDNEEVNYRRILNQYIARIEEVDGEAVPENPNVPLGLEGVEPTLGLLEWAAAQQSSLEELKQSRESHIQSMYDQLEGLWRRLGVDEAAMDAFVEMHRGSTEDVVREYEEELERMLELKQESMAQFIQSAREEIVKLWDDLMVGEDERADFAPFADGMQPIPSILLEGLTFLPDEFTEELLNIHEDEIRKLKEERRMKAPLLSSIKKYFMICDEEKELQAAASDQTRLLGRGRDPGRLLREEKMRKRVQKEKPRLEQDLLVSIPAWEQETGKPFLVHGQMILQVIMEAVSAKEQENAKRKTRSASAAGRATTPTASSSSQPSGGYVPGKGKPPSRTGTVTPAVRPRSVTGSTMKSVPNKRQRLGDSTSSTASHYSNSNSTSHHNANSNSHLRVPLSSHRNNHRPGSPTSRIPSSSKTPGQGSVARTRAASAIIASGSTARNGTAPAPGSQQRRYPSAPGMVARPAYVSTTVTRAAGSVGTAPKPVAKVVRTARESFKPRPSIDHLEMKMGVNGVQGWAGALEEEEED
ncbi:hypothetical protein NMY22_g6771 [Coprinellus aureogranulatus]|nr:hypothetical protein NMY22_g6771 [Coprinellus aureogranulatus]